MNLKKQKKNNREKLHIILVFFFFIACVLSFSDTISYFVGSNTIESTLRVTNSHCVIEGSLMFDDDSNSTVASLLSGLENDENVDNVIGFSEYFYAFFVAGEEMDIKNIEKDSIKIYKDDQILLNESILVDENRVEIIFSREYIKSLLGQGNHNILMEGIHKNGWIKFVGQGTLVVIDEDVEAEKEALRLVEELEADSHNLYQERIDQVKSAVEALRESDLKEDLLVRVDIVQIKLDKIIQAAMESKLLESAISALEKAEESKTPEDYLMAQELIIKLAEGEQKDLLLARLKEIDVINDSDEGQETVSDNVYRKPYELEIDASEINKISNNINQEDELLQ